MMTLPEFELHRPTTLDEATGIAAKLSAEGHAFDFIAGGTDLLQNYKNRINCAPHVISLKGVKELHALEPTQIGALVPLRELERWADCPQGMQDALHDLASPLIRETATIGGNLLVDTRCFFFNQSAFWRHSLGYCLKAEGTVCHVVPQEEICYATSSSDLAPILLVLDARLDLTGPDGTRNIPIRSFYVDEGRAVHSKEPNEILSRVHIPAESAKLATGYRKLRLRDTMDFPAMGVAIGVEFTKKGTLQDLRIAIGGVSAAPLYLDSVCAPYLGKKPSGDLLDALATDAMNATQPVKNLVVPTRYRKKMVKVYTRRLLGELVGETQVAVLRT
jgi:4-hydroxybenzoyl-CoA reductase subunit beta